MKFKKHISLFLAFFLLVSNMGLAFNVHYCGGKVASIDPVYLSLNSNSIEKDCCGTKVVKKDSCCKDKTFHFQKKSDDSIIKAFSFNANLSYINAECSYITAISAFNSKPRRVTSYYSEANGPPLFKLYHQYLFYD